MEPLGCFAVDFDWKGEDTPLTAEVKYGIGFWDSWRGLCLELIVFFSSYLARFPSKPSGAAEACLRALLRWLLTDLRRVQIMPSLEGSPSIRSVVSFCDASWNVASVSGRVLMFEGCYIKVFSRKPERKAELVR